MAAAEIFHDTDPELAERMLLKRSDREDLARHQPQIIKTDENFQTGENSRAGPDIPCPIAEKIDHEVLAIVDESKKLDALRKWLQKFIHEEGIEMGTEDETSISSEEPEISNPDCSIYIVPERLKKVYEKEEDCFTPQAFVIGLHNVVSCFDASKVQYKFEIAKAFSDFVLPVDSQSPRSKSPEKWKQLVKAIVGCSAEEHKKVTDAYKDFRRWDLKVDSSSSVSPVIKYWHFGLLLAVDAVFLVVVLKKNNLENHCDSPQEIRSLINSRLFEISEFEKWDLSLVENQIPLVLLRKVIELLVKKEGVPEEKVKSATDMQLEMLIKQAVWLSYPFLPNDCERRCCQDFIGCCCPFACVDEDIEEGIINSPGSESSKWSSGDDFQYFEEGWSRTYKMSFSPENCTHLLDCTYVVSSWLKPDAAEPSSKLSTPGQQGRFKGRSLGSLTSQKTESRAVQLLRSLMLPSAGSDGGNVGGRLRRQRRFIRNDDRIPSATQLVRAGVRIRGVATTMADARFETMNFWTILSSMCCFVSLLACCFESGFSSYISRWRASLELPTVKIFTETTRLLRNIAVYEELTHGCRNGLWRNYVKTMRCLLEREEDVLLLIRSGVIQSHLAGPQEVVHTWKYIDDGLEAAPLGGLWVKIYHNLHEHLQNRWKIWYARFWISNCSNPLVACSFIIFVILFLLSAFGMYLNLAKSKSDGDLLWP